MARIEHSARLPSGSGAQRIDSVNYSDAMFLRVDDPGCIRHRRGGTFSQIYLSYLGGPGELRITPSEFCEVFPPDEKFNYRHDVHELPEHFILGFGGRPIKAGQSFSAAFLFGYFNTIAEMHSTADRHKGHTALRVDGLGWRLVK